MTCAVAVRTVEACVLVICELVAASTRPDSLRGSRMRQAVVHLFWLVFV